jgi:DNA-binding phage protein
MMETKTAQYDVAEILATPEEMAAYLEACIQESVRECCQQSKGIG